MTKSIYLESPEIYEITAKIIESASDEKGDFIIFDQTIFYPQGGGQPADQGRVQADEKTYTIYDTRRVEGQIQHYLTPLLSDSIEGSKVTLILDKERRILNTRYHTAGHLIAALAQEISTTMKPTKGHHFPGEASVQFNGEPEDKISFLDKLQIEINKTISDNKKVQTNDLDPMTAKKIMNDLSYKLPTNKKLRVCNIAGFPSVPCGGTHVMHLGELKKIKILKCKTKKGQTKISYQL